MDAEDGQLADDMRADAQAAGRLAGASLAGGRQPAASCQGRLAAWQQAAWYQDAEGRLAESPQVASLPDLPLQAFRRLHLQVGQEADWQSVARDVCWATAKHLA